MSLANSVKLANNEAKRQLLIDKADYEASLIISNQILGPDTPGYINPFADRLITDSNDKILSDDKNIKNTMEGYLNNVADPEIAKYILNKLSIEQMRILIPNWNELLVKLKRTNKKFTKDTFYNWLVAFLKELNQEVSLTLGTLVIPGSSSTSSSSSIISKTPIGLPKPASIDFKTELSKALLERTTPEKVDSSLKLIEEIESKKPAEKPVTKFWYELLKAKERMIKEKDNLKKDKVIVEDMRDNIKGIKMTDAREKEKKIFYEQMRIEKENEEALRIAKEEALLKEKEKDELYRLKGEQISLQMVEEQKAIDKIIKAEKVRVRKLGATTFYDDIKKNYGINIEKPARGGVKQAKEDFITNVLNDEVRKRYINDKRGNNSVDGKGIRIQLRKPIKKRVITGKGITADKKPIERYLQINDVHKIDMLKLNQEMPSLHCLYLAQKSKPLNKLSNVPISKDSVEVIKNMLNEKFNQKEYSLLPLEQRRIIQQFNKQCKFNLNIPDKDNEEAVNKFNMCYGEFKSGNNNPELLKQLKKQVILFMNEKLISQKDANSILLQIALS